MTSPVDVDLGPGRTADEPALSFRRTIGWPTSWPDGRFLLLALYLFGTAVLGGVAGFGAAKERQDFVAAAACLSFAAAVSAYAAVGWRRWQRARRVVVVLTGCLLALALLLDIEIGERLALGALVGLAGAVVLSEPRRPALQRLYLCRFPLLGALLLAGTPIAAVFGYSHILGNMFVLHWEGIVLVTFLAVLASWIVAATWRTILLYAEMRFRLRPVGADKLLGLFPAEIQLLLLALPAAPAVVVLIWQADEPSPWLAGLAAFAGALAARVMLAASALLVAWITPPETTLHLPLPIVGRKRLESLLRTEVRHSRELRRLLASGLKGSEAGYLDAQGGLLPGHALSIGFFTVTLLIYLSALLLDPFRSPDVPALFFLLLLFMLVAWLLPTLSFFLDKFRIPTLPALLALACFGYFVGDLDHYYELRDPRPAAVHLASPASAVSAPVKAEASCPLEIAVVKRRASFLQQHPDHPPVIVAVAAGGGGIAASAWTARVLDELQTRFGPELADSLHLISSVSGGGVGAMYYLDAFFPETVDPYSSRHRPAPPDPARRAEVRQRAASSSLGATAWGLAYHDVRRALAFLHPERRNQRDRAWAMEQVWRRRLGRPYDREPTLESWRPAVLLGRLPIPVFNATVVETGRRQILSPLNLSSDHHPDRCDLHMSSDAKTSHTLYGEHELPVVTAARLSATFPFVTPVARALTPTGEPRGHHLADGGYFDNSGLVTTMDFVRSTLELMKRGRIDRHPILVVEIRAFRPLADPEPMHRAGWLDLATSPMTTMMRVRTASQIARNEQEMALLRELGEHRRVQIETVVFEPETSVRAPLSWHLSEAEREAIASSSMDAPLDRVACFLSRQGWPVGHGLSGDDCPPSEV